MKQQPPAIVVGLEGNGLGVVRSLGRAGVPVVALTSDPRQPTAKSKYCRVLSCPDERTEALVQRLVEIGARQDRQTPLFLTMDRTVQIVSRHRELLQPYFLFNLPDKAVIERLNDKRGFTEFAVANGFRVPATESVDSTASLQAAASRLRFPLIIKPLGKGSGFDAFFSARAIKVATSSVLQTRFEGFTWTAPLLVQEYVPGDPSAIHFCLAYLNRESKILSHFVGRKIRIWPLDTGNTTSAQPVEDPEVFETSVELFKRAGLRGLCSLEFKRHPATGELFMIEPTIGRTDWQSEVAPVNGVNIPLVSYCDLLGLPLPVQHRKDKPVRWIDYVNDYRAAQATISSGELSLEAYRTSVAAPRAFSLFAWDDPVPRLAALSKQIKAKGRGLLLRLLDALPMLYPLFVHVIPPDLRWPSQEIIASLKRHDLPQASFVKYFTRDPERTLPLERNILVSPADGVVRSIFERDGRKLIEISMSFYDVHVQRFPISGRVLSVEETGKRVHPGSEEEQRYFADPWSYESDYLFPVQRVTTLDTTIGEVVIRQISSIWARRITTLAIPGEEVQIGQRMGNILFGSTVILEMPDCVDLAVEAQLHGRHRRRDDKTIVAGETVVARYN